MTAKCEDLCKALENVGLSALAPYFSDLVARVEKLETKPVEHPHVTERKELEHHYAGKQHK